MEQGGLFSSLDIREEEWLKGRRAVYYVAAQIPYPQLFDEFSETVLEQLDVAVPKDFIVALKILSREKVAVVVDEFQSKIYVLL